MSFTTCVGSKRCWHCGQPLATVYGKPELRGHWYYEEVVVQGEIRRVHKSCLVGVKSDPNYGSLVFPSKGT